MGRVLRTNPGIPVCFRESEGFSGKVCLGGRGCSFVLRAGWDKSTGAVLAKTQKQQSSFAGVLQRCSEFLLSVKERQEYQSSSNFAPWKSCFWFWFVDFLFFFFQMTGSFLFMVIRWDDHRKKQPPWRSCLIAPHAEGSAAPPGHSSHTTLKRGLEQKARSYNLKAVETSRLDRMVQPCSGRYLLPASRLKKYMVLYLLEFNTKRSISLQKTQSIWQGGIVSFHSRELKQFIEVVILN